MAFYFTGGGHGKDAGTPIIYDGFRTDGDYSPLAHNSDAAYAEGIRLTEQPAFEPAVYEPAVPAYEPVSAADLTAYEAEQLEVLAQQAHSKEGHKIVRRSHGSTGGHGGKGGHGGGNGFGSGFQEHKDKIIGKINDFVDRIHSKKVRPIF